MITSEEILSRGSGSKFKNAEKTRVKNPENPEIPLRYPDKKPTLILIINYC